MLSAALQDKAKGLRRAVAQAVGWIGDARRGRRRSAAIPEHAEASIYCCEAARVPSGGSVAGAILFSQQIGQSMCA